MSRRRLAAFVAVLALVTAGTAAAAPVQARPAPPPKLNFIGSIVARVFTGSADFVSLQVLDTTRGDTESLAAVVDEPNVELAAGTVTVRGSGGTEAVTIPMTNVMGALHDGDHLQVTVSDVQTSGGVQNATTAKTTTLTCALDPSGNGACA
jgi:hypothetical protein